MFCGLDFGTSNCSLGLWRDGKPVLARVGRDGPYMPSVAYAERAELSALPIDEGQLQIRIAAAMRAERTRRTEAKRRNRRYAGLSEREIASRERSLMQREAARATADAFSRQTIATALQGTGRLLFGEDAIDANALTPMDGFYFKSPKLFLGSEVQDTHLDVFSQVITAMIAEVRQRAELEAGHAITQAAIGHPVVYSLSRALAGNGQALEIMERCARKAGFADIVFLPEPLAAAFNYERTVTHEEIVLVVDVGGGTTDCAVVRVGPRRASVADRASDVLAYAGDRVGGGMMDFHLAWRALMPSFGKDRSAISSTAPPSRTNSNACSSSGRRCCSTAWCAAPKRRRSDSARRRRSRCRSTISTRSCRSGSPATNCAVRSKVIWRASPRSPAKPQPAPAHLSIGCS